MGLLGLFLGLFWLGRFYFSGNGFDKERSLPLYWKSVKVMRTVFGNTILASNMGGVESFRNSLLPGSGADT